ncbi:hypothetical protein J3F84DRAFT_97234 [Trichoderma pleuroticola]
MYAHAATAGRRPSSVSYMLVGVVRIRTRLGAETWLLGHLSRPCHCFSIPARGVPLRGEGEGSQCGVVVHGLQPTCTPSRPFPIIFTPLPALDGKVRISNLRLTPRPEPRYDRPPKLASSDAKASAIQYRGFAGQGPTRTHLNLLFFWGRRAKGLVRAASHLNKTDFGPLLIGQAARGVRSLLRTGQALE